MAIIRNGDQFHLQTETTSYVLALYQGRYVTQLYWGARLDEAIDLSVYAGRSVTPRSSFHAPMGEHTLVFTDQRFEFSTLGNGDYRVPTYLAKYADGSTVSEFDVADVRILEGKPALKGLPATYVEASDEAETLEIDLCDARTGMTVTLSYSVFEHYNAIARSIRYHNKGTADIVLASALSASVDLRGMDYEVLHLHGDWYRERDMERMPVHHGRIQLGSNRGMSSHMENPFVAVMDRGATERTGRVYGFSLVYSGSFSATVEGNSANLTRVAMGIQPENFEWTLEPGEAFQTPEVVMIASDQGLGAMSRGYHKLYRERLARGRWRDEARPMVLNTWEGSYFAFDEARIIDMARAAKRAGVDLLVMDDGWFGKRNHDDSSLGDWFVNEDKIPNGLHQLCEAVKQEGVGFGIWVEPEMISPNSDLYRKHPDWCIHAEGRRRTEARQQLVLDYARSDVRAYIVERMTEIFGAAQFAYVKWDCNRNIIETQSPAQSHQFMLGVYEVMETLVTRFPEILFESCSGGGGRFDPGMLYYMPQAWTSDNTHPDQRLRIQHGSSMVYPTSMMAAHVGNGIMQGAVQRELTFSAHVAMAGVFGYEMDATRFTEEEMALAKALADQYRAIRQTVQYGDLYRLESPFEGAFASWQFVSRDQDEVLLFTYQLERQLNQGQHWVRLEGLDSQAMYRLVPEGVATHDLLSHLADKLVSGELLMQFGFAVPPFNDREYACLFRFVRA